MSLHLHNSGRPRRSVCLIDPREISRASRPGCKVMREQTGVRIFGSEAGNLESFEAAGVDRSGPVFGESSFLAAKLRIGSALFPKYGRGILDHKAWAEDR